MLCRESLVCHIILQTLEVVLTGPLETTKAHLDMVLRHLQVTADILRLPWVLLAECLPRELLLKVAILLLEVTTPRLEMLRLLVTELPQLSIRPPLLLALSSPVTDLLEHLLVLLADLLPAITELPAVRRLPTLLRPAADPPV